MKLRRTCNVEKNYRSSSWSFNWLFVNRIKNVMKCIPRIGVRAMQTSWLGTLLMSHGGERLLLLFRTIPSYYRVSTDLVSATSSETDWSTTDTSNRGHRNLAHSPVAVFFMHSYGRNRRGICTWKKDTFLMFLMSQSFFFTIRMQS